MKERNHYSLLHHNTFGIEASCRRFVEYATEEEARQTALSLTQDDYPLLIIGAGSNLLLTADYPSTVITPENRFDVSPRECGTDVLLRCWAGTTFDDVVAYAVEHHWHGAENLSLIPGEVGASAVQNIGAYGAEAQDIISKVEAVEIATGKVVTIDAADCGYSYRQSRFKHEWRDKYLITYVTYRLSSVFSPHLDYGNIRQRLAENHIESPTPQQLRETIISIRRDKLPDPAVEGNAGSFFMNPIVSRDVYQKMAAQWPGMPHYSLADGREKIPAGWMIEQCGWKGKSLGRAGVHSKQALVLVNRGGATGADVVRLCKAIQADVKTQFGIDIYPEVNIR